MELPPALSLPPSLIQLMLFVIQLLPSLLEHQHTHRAFSAQHSRRKNKEREQDADVLGRQNIAEELGAMLDAIENEGVEIQVTPAADGSRRATATTTQVRARDLAKRVPSKEDAEKIVAELRSSHM